jgi:hypothetical protein
MPSTDFDKFCNDTLLDIRQQRQFFGDRSESFLERRELAAKAERERRARAGLPAEPGPGEPPIFPESRYIGPRKYRRLGDLRAYVAALPVKPPVTDNVPPTRVQRIAFREAAIAKAAAAAAREAAAGSSNS